MEVIIHTFHLPTGRIELEVYRLGCLVHGKFRKYAKRLSRLRPVVGALAATAFFAIAPVVGVRPAAGRFPTTDRPLAFTANTTPLALRENRIEIKPAPPPAEAPKQSAGQNRRPSVTKTALAAYPPCPESWRSFYQEVGPRFGVPWQILEAIHQVESGKSCHTNRRSYAGATGPMQFVPSTWRKYQWDCTGDGVADITNAYDSICTAAHYIGTGLTGYSLDRAIYSYNRSWSYVNKVMSIAREIGYEG